MASWHDAYHAWIRTQPQLFFEVDIDPQDRRVEPRPWSSLTAQAAGDVHPPKTSNERGERKTSSGRALAPQEVTSR